MTFNQAVNFRRRRGLQRSNLAVPPSTNVVGVDLMREDVDSVATTGGRDKPNEMNKLVNDY